MNLSVGIVGLPNVGKSTLFNALLKKQVALAANYPFATIEPNVGVVPVPDHRLSLLADLLEKQIGKKPPIVPAVIEFVDIAGLVAGASKGEGLGNQFLSHIREVDVICHVLRAFEGNDVVRVGSVSAKDDYKTVETELQLADLSTLEKQKEPKGATDKTEKFRWGVVEKLRFALNSGISAREVLSTKEEQKVARQLGLLTSTSELFMFNIDEKDLSKRENILNDISIALQKDPKQCVVISAQLESELAELSLSEQVEYLDDIGLDKSGLERLTSVAYHTLGLQSFLTAGEKEIRAWTIPHGTLAVEAAGVIHTDFSKKFIKAHVISFEQFIALGGWKEAREQGKVRQEGRGYTIKEGDVVEFMIGT